MDQEIQRVIKIFRKCKYTKKIERQSSKDVIWSVRDVSIILYEIMWLNQGNHAKFEVVRDLSSR